MCLNCTISAISSYYHYKDISPALTTQVKGPPDQVYYPHKSRFNSSNIIKTSKSLDIQNLFRIDLMYFLRPKLFRSIIFIHLMHLIHIY